MTASRIQWVGFGLLLLMAVRVSITPGVKHRHEHGDRPHSHHHGDGTAHHHPHAHPHEEQPPSANSHIHITIFGWELTLSTPRIDQESPDTAPTTGISTETAEPADILSDEVCLQSAVSWGTLIQWVLEVRSPAPPACLKLPRGDITAALGFLAPGLSSRDRQPPLLPPPERISPLETTC
jgi:hypothetical protein